MSEPIVEAGLPPVSRAGLTPRWVWPAIALIAAATVVSSPVLGSPLGLVLPGFVVLALAGVFVWRSPLLAASFVPALMPPPQFAKVFAYEVALLFTAGLVLLAGLRARREWIWKLDAIEAAVAGLLLWAVCTGFWSESLWWWTFGVRKLGIGFLALWTAWRLGRCFQDRWLPLGIVTSIYALGLATLVKAASVGAFTSGASYSRSEGTSLGWGTSNFIGALLVLMLPTALHTALHDPRRGMRVTAWMTLPLVALVVAVAASRGGALLVVLVALLLVFGGRIRRRTLLVLAGFALAIGAILAGPSGAQLLERFTSPRELGSVVVRLLYFREGWRRLLEYLPWGMGLGQGLVQLDRLATADPHNYWLVVGPELGLPGLALWVTVLVLIWRRAQAMARSAQTRAMARTLQFTLIISQVNSLYEPTFQGLQYQFLFYWIVGTCLGVGSAAATVTSAGEESARDQLRAGITDSPRSAT